MSFIDASYFVGELEIPNSGETSVNERILWFIQKYEPQFLQKLFGYQLYKAFVAGLNVVAPIMPDIRWINLLYGAEYTDVFGYLQKWRGLIVTDAPIYNIAGGYIYRRPEYLTAGSSPGLIAGTNTFTFNGVTGTPDWRGWTPVLTRSVPMVPDVDYSWNAETGTLVLLVLNDKFSAGERIKAEFEQRTDAAPSLGVTPTESCIANYVYYFFRKATGTQTTGIGEVITNAENSKNVAPRKKMARAWNEMRCITKECIAFIEQNRAVYPEWTDINKIDALKYFNYMNPIF